VLIITEEGGEEKRTLPTDQRLVSLTSFCTVHETLSAAVPRRKRVNVRGKGTFLGTLARWRPIGMDVARVESCRCPPASSRETGASKSRTRAAGRKLTYSRRSLLTLSREWSRSCWC
jgi:hypothetical protein